MHSRAADSFSLFLLLFPFILFATSGCLHAGESGIVITEKLQLRVADAFMDEGEYYRAVTEYKRFLIIFPESDRADYAQFRIALSYQKGEEYVNAARNFALLRSRYPASSLYGEAFYREGMSCLMDKKHHEALSLFTALAETHPEGGRAPHALAAAAIAAIEADDPAAGAMNLDLFLSRYPAHERVDSVRDARRMLDDYEELPQKSPVLAAVMSAILPGSGHIYAGHTEDGLTALMLNGLFIAGAVVAAGQENYATATVTGVIGLPFYFGNIYGAANAAKKWNRTVRREMRGKIRDALGFVFE